MLIYGIDVARYQGVIDWGRVAQGCSITLPDGSRHPCRFAIPKISEGGDDTYKLARANCTGARKAGLVLMVYHFATVYYAPQGPLDWYEEAKATLQALKNCGALDAAVVWLDLEKWRKIEAEDVTPEEVMTFIWAWMGYLDRHLDAELGIYLSAKAFSEHGSGRVPDDNGLESLPLWVADYAAERKGAELGKPRLPGDWKDWMMQQVTSKAKVDGIDDEVDVNVIRAADFKRLLVRRGHVMRRAA